MKKGMAALLTGISMAALLAGGCANKEAVKKEEPVQPSVSVTQVEPTKPVTQAEPVVASDNGAELARLAEQERLAALKSAAIESKFQTVYFDFDKSDLRQDARDVLSKNAEVIQKSAAGTKFQIEGHCDERGSAEYNLALGERRAKSVQNYLTTLGVKADLLSIISYGKEKPAVQGNDEAAWAKNRRAEFVVAR